MQILVLLAAILVALALTELVAKRRQRRAVAEVRVPMMRERSLRVVDDAHRAA